MIIVLYICGIIIGYLFLGCIVIGLLKRYCERWAPADYEWELCILLWLLCVIAIIGEEVIAPSCKWIYDNWKWPNLFTLTFVRFSKWIGGVK